MNRFEYAQAVLRDDETFVAKHTNMKLYHGHQKVLNNITMRSFNLSFKYAHLRSFFLNL